MSSIAANSFCRAFLLMWVPRQTFTRLVNCLAEYSWAKKANHILVSSKRNDTAQKIRNVLLKEKEKEENTPRQNLSLSGEIFKATHVAIICGCEA